MAIFRANVNDLKMEAIANMSDNHLSNLTGCHKEQCKMEEEERV